MRSSVILKKSTKPPRFYCLQLQVQLTLPRKFNMVKNASKIINSECTNNLVLNQEIKRVSISCAMGRNEPLRWIQSSVACFLLQVKIILPKHFAYFCFITTKVAHRRSRSHHLASWFACQICFGVWSLLEFIQISWDNQSNCKLKSITKQIVVASEPVEN